MLKRQHEQYVPPTEYTFVGTSETRSCFHAAVRLDPIKRVLVAAAPTSQHRLKWAEKKKMLRGLQVL